MDTTQTTAYAAVLSRLADQVHDGYREKNDIPGPDVKPHTFCFLVKARSALRDLDPVNEVSFLRLRSKKNEILLAPDKDFTLIVIQSPSEAEFQLQKGTG